MEIDEAEIELFCGYCLKPFDRDKWIADETCIHCGKFLDSPPNLFQKRIRKVLKNLEEKNKNNCSSI